MWSRGRKAFFPATAEEVTRTHVCRRARAIALAVMPLAILTSAVPGELASAVRARALEEGISTSAMVRRAILAAFSEVAIDALPAERPPASGGRPRRMGASS